MLYDPKWEKHTETKADPLSLEALLAWLEKRPTDAAYDYGSTDNCLVCQFLKFSGIEEPRAGGNYWRQRFKDDERHFFHENICAIVTPMPHTYGAALERARAAL